MGEIFGIVLLGIIVIFLVIGLYDLERRVFELEMEIDTEARRKEREEE